jgi:hypothetical protein
MKTPLLKRFMDKVSPEPMSGCWLWTGAVDQNGYGRIWSGGITDAGNKRALIAPRVSYQEHVGPIPEGLVVRHICDNPACVAPYHLEIGTMKQNVRDMIDRGRDKFRLDLKEREHCINGHPFAGENLYFSEGRRRCRKCDVEKTLRSRNKSKGKHP